MVIRMDLIHAPNASGTAMRTTLENMRSVTGFSLLFRRISPLHSAQASRQEQSSETVEPMAMAAQAYSIPRSIYIVSSATQITMRTTSSTI